MTALLLALVLGLQAFAVRGLSTPATYSTTFTTGTENPIAESGTGWQGGSATALLWSNVQTTTGKAFGTQSEGSHGSCGGCTYNDSMALKNPPAGHSWANNLTVKGRVFITSRAGWTGFHEVELLQRVTFSGNRARGYEGEFSVIGGTTYYEIIRWEGPQGDPAVPCVAGCAYTSLVSANCAGIEDGTYLRFTSVGTVLTLQTSTDDISYATACSGAVTYDTAGDSVKYASGLPGIGLWTNGVATISTYGFSQWSAQ